MPLSDLLQALGEEIQDPEEESFLLFSQAIPSQNLGFIDPKATSLDITVAGRDLLIQQSPTLLSSNRKEGTTGAVVWKITPLFANWIASENNILFDTSALDASSTVLELGCGVSGIVGVALSPRIRRYIATDQEYVFKTLTANVENNTPRPKTVVSGKKRREKSAAPPAPKPAPTNIQILPLDWESTLLSSLPTLLRHGKPPHEPALDLDLILACDCVFNEALIHPFVRTCAELCLSGKEESNLLSKATPPHQKPTLCIVAQQLRSHSVFEAWLEAFHAAFRVWRVPERLMTEGLRGGEGFVVHVGVLRGVGGGRDE